MLRNYIVNDLIVDVEAISVASGRANTRDRRVSMGGLGAVKLALSHPELFCSLVESVRPLMSQPSVFHQRFTVATPQSFLDRGKSGTTSGDPLCCSIRRSCKTPYPLSHLRNQEGYCCNRNFAALLEYGIFAIEFHVFRVATLEQWDRVAQCVSELVEARGRTEAEC